MLAEYKNKTNIGVGLGIILHVAARVLMAKSPIVSSLLLVAGSVLFIWGCCNYSMAKGHHWAFGFFALLSIIGLIILICFPDKNREPRGLEARIPPPPDKPTPPDTNTEA